MLPQFCFLRFWTGRRLGRSPLLGLVRWWLAGLIAGGLAAAPEVWRLGTDFDAPRSTPAGDGFDDRVVQEACRRVGVAMQPVRLPAARALENADDGVDDGVYSRIEGFEVRYPGLVRVPESLGEIVYVAFSRNPRLVIENWVSLKPLAVAVVIGRATSERGTMDVPDLVRVREVGQLFQMLHAGRVDVVVYDHWQGVAAAQREGVADLVVHAPALDRKPLFLYLNRRHAALVPPLTEALRAMKRDGTYARLQAETRTLIHENAPAKN